MAKIVVQSEADPDIGIVLADNGLTWAGRCTECGHLANEWDMESAIRSAKAHITGKHE